MNNETQQEQETIEATGQLAVIERASIDCQIETAKKYPRKLSKVKDQMLSLATLDEETAASCFYTLPRGGKTIQGPSVRMAEIAASCWGNLRVGSRTIATDADSANPHVVVQSVCHDLETNTAITIEKRRRITKKKNKENVDEDDIQLATNACASIALRDAVFKIVPRALIQPIYEKAKQVAVGDVKSLAITRQKVVDRLKQMGAKEDRIFAVVGATKIDDIDQDGVEKLIGLGTALKDGATTLEEAFPVSQIQPVAFVKSTPQQASAIQPEPAVPADFQPQQIHKDVADLALFVTSKGADFAKFKRGVKAMNLFPESADWQSFNDVQPEIAAKLMANQSGLEFRLK